MDPKAIANPFEEIQGLAILLTSSKKKELREATCQRPFACQSFHLESSFLPGFLPTFRNEQKPGKE
jgi:hypothetical protein